MAIEKKGGIICGCSVLREEIESLRKTLWPDWTARYLSSMLHMKPAELTCQLDACTTEELSAGNRVVLVYGDCCHAVDRIEKTLGVARTRGVNCCEMLLGREMYKSLMKDGAFFLLPEWTRRWEEVFTHELGLSQENAQDLMQEMHTRLLYLDTGIEPVPSDSIASCSAYCGLPVEIRQIPLTHLQMLIEDAMDRVCMGAP